MAHKDDKTFKAFIVDRVIATQLDLLRSLNSGGVNHEVGGVNNEIKNQIGGVNSLDLLILQVIQSSPGLNAPALAIESNKSLRTVNQAMVFNY